jgi:hypothetical protein
MSVRWTAVRAEGERRPFLSRLSSEKMLMNINGVWPVYSDGTQDSVRPAKEEELFVLKVTRRSLSVMMSFRKPTSAG